MTTEIEKTRVNVAPSSNNGHFVEDAQQVIDLDKVNELFYVKGKSRLVTENHTTLEMEEDCMITCQVVYNAFAQGFKKISHTNMDEFPLHVQQQYTRVLD